MQAKILRNGKVNYDVCSYYVMKTNTAIWITWIGDWHGLEE